MPVLGFTSVSDMFDGGGAGKKGGPSSWAGTPFAGGGSGGGSNLLSGIGSLLGLAVGGPGGAAIGAGLGNLLSGGNINSAFNAGLGTFIAGAGGGPGGVVMNALTGGGAPGGGAGQNILSQLAPGLGAQPAPQGGVPARAPAAQQGPLGGIMNLLNSPLIMAALIKATEPKNVSLVSPEERRMMQTGERLPDYEGRPMFDYNIGQRFAKGGFIEGPGHGTSDSIPAKIYQNGGPVREARLSDGEFVMTNRAVRGAGNGDRARGAAEMYRMMHQFERRA